MKKKRVYEDRSNDIVEVFPEYSENFSDMQLKHAWMPKEVRVAKDKQNLMVDMSPAARHGVLTTLRLFTNYEVFAGEDWWAGRFQKIMKGPEFTRMGSMFSMAELCVHKPFYQQLNEVFGLDTEDFYKDYVNNPTLKSRMDHVDAMINHENDMVALGAFTFVEGGILYSAFGLLKSYQANGWNDIKTIVSGINYSLADEGLHFTGAGTAYRHMKKELIEDGEFEKRYGKLEDVENALRQIAKTVYEHEIQIIGMVFEKGSEGVPVTREELIAFVGARLNACLQQLGIDPIFSEEGDTISEWFYKNITSFVMIDFFNSLGSQYTSAWLEEDFDPDNVEE